MDDGDIGTEEQAFQEAFFVLRSPFRRPSFLDVGRGEDRVVFELSPSPGDGEFHFQRFSDNHLLYPTEFKSSQSAHITTQFQHLQLIHPIQHHPLNFKCPRNRQLHHDDIHPVLGNGRHSEFPTLNC